MNTGFVVLQPILLAGAGGVFLLLPALVPGARGHRRRWLLPAAYALLATLLVLSGRPLAHALLMLLAVAAAVYFAVVYYARPRLPLRPATRWACGLCRALALVFLLLLLGRPAWNSEFQEWHRPLLVALLDQSGSIGLRDQTAGRDAPTRAEQANAALGGQAAALGGLETYYDVRRMALDPQGRPLDTWKLEPRDKRTPIAASLRRAALQRSSLGQTPAGLLLLTDGAENVADPAAVVTAGQALAQREIPLLAVGVGPGPEQTPGMLLEPLALPGEIGLRDELAVDLVAHTFGCGGESLLVELEWDEPEQTRRVRVARDRETIRSSFRVLPPRAGLLRLTGRVQLPDTLGGDLFETSQVIQVRNETMRVLLLMRQPSSELAFLTRALRSDPRFELTVDLRPVEHPAAARDDWHSFDVVILGRVRLTRAETAELVTAVRTHGTGLLLAGGRRLLNDPEIPLGDLADISPAGFLLRNTRPRPVRAGLTRRSAGHEVLAGLLENGRLPDLPPLAGGAELGSRRQLAETLLVDERGDPLLVVQEIGRGRCGVATWEATWPWALASDAGRAWHRQFWQQFSVWLANRRPQGWVLPDQARYAVDSLAGGQQIEIRAGVTGSESGGLRQARWTGRLELARVDQAATQPATVPIPLTRDGPRWTAALPRAVPGLDLDAGAWRLKWTATAELPDREPLTLTAESGFFVERIDPELRSPTANLGLLRRAAEQTAEVGGRYVDLDDLGMLLGDLMRTDPRESVTRRTQRIASEAYPWWLWGAVVLLLSGEWVLRKRAGLP